MGKNAEADLIFLYILCLDFFIPTLTLTFCHFRFTFTFSLGFRRLWGLWRHIELVPALVYENI